ncbi:MAG: IS1595 family transposase [Dongiaceae bacterium]
MSKNILTQAFFHDEAAAFAKLESIVWPNGPVCPKCGVVDRAYPLNGVKDKKGRVRHGLKKCGACRGQYTVRIGTVFEASHVPLHLWLQATFLMCSSKKGISSNQLHRTLGVTLKTAWFMSHRLREAMRSDKLPPIGGAGAKVEADETFIGNKKDRKKRPGGFAHKHVVFSLVERGGELRSFHIDRANAKNVRDVMVRQVSPKSAVMTDDASYYRWVGDAFADHQSVNHKAEEWVRGIAHTNTLEGFFSIFKRGMRGIYQHCGEAHLHRYLSEFDFRYNHRSTMVVDDYSRTAAALSGIVGKRLTYRDSSNGE